MEHVVERVGVAVGAWLNCQLSEANHGNLYVGAIHIQTAMSAH